MSNIFIENLSGYRGVSSDIQNYSARGYLRFLIGLSQIVLFTSLYMLYCKQGSRFLLYILVTLSFIIAFSMSVFTSSRANLIMIFIQILILKSLTQKKGVSITALLLYGFLIFFFFTFMTMLRAGSGLTINDTQNMLMNFFSHVIVNNGGIDLSKTILVKYYVDQTFNLKFGSTLLLFIVLAVPRAFWSGKPTNLDTFIGHEVYGSSAYGTGAVPPGFVAEMYLNFHYGGVIFGLFALGYITRLLHNDFEKRKHIEFYPLYFVLVILNFLYSVMGSGFSSTVMSSLMNLLPILFFIRR